MKTLIRIATFTLMFIAALAASAQTQCTVQNQFGGLPCALVSAPVGTSIKLTGQTTGLTATTLCSTTTCPAGLYAVRGYLIVTGTATLGSAQIGIAYSDDAGSTTQNLGSAVSLTTAARLSFDQTIELSGTSGINATVTLSGLTGTPTYNVYLTAVQLTAY